MTRQVVQILLYLISFLLLVRCAQVAPLTGGPKDTTPPQLKQAIPANQSVNFNSDLIVLSFDEFVQVTDVANNLIISPKLPNNPTINASGKQVTIELKKDDLKPNTTYRFYLGQAIADTHEGNPIRNFEYTFSTGNYIDSLKISGQVNEAYNNKPAGDVVVALYSGKENSDSLPYKQTPDYVSRTDDNGSFSFSNLPYTTFRAYAFSDKNKNNLYDGEVEKIAFRDSLLELKSDSSLSFRLFREEPPKFFIKKALSPYYGVVMVLLSKKTKSVVKPLLPENSTNIYETNPGQLKDTISVYYKNIRDTLALLIENPVLKQNDTLTIPLPKRPASKRKFSNMTLNTPNNTLIYNTRPRITFSVWMDTIRTDLSKLSFRDKADTVHAPARVNGNWINATTFEIRNTMSDAHGYEIKADTNAFYDIRGLANDSLKLSFTTQSKTDLGKVTLKVILNKKQDYVVQLTDEKENVVVERFISLSLSSSNVQTLDIIDLPPATYTVKIIFDDNKNRKWDTGHLILKQQPERVIIHPKQIKVLSDWEIEEEIPVKD